MKNCFLKDVLYEITNFEMQQTAQNTLRKGQNALGTPLGEFWRKPKVNTEVKKCKAAEM